MSYNLVATPAFEKELKKLIKKYPSIKEDLRVLKKELLLNPIMGIEVYKNCYKIRLAIKSKGKGKSGGGRVITHVRVEKEKIYLLAIYDKSDQETVTDSLIKSRLGGL